MRSPLFPSSSSRMHRLLLVLAVGALSLVVLIGAPIAMASGYGPGARAPSNPAAPLGESSIGDYVWRDYNVDGLHTTGVVDESEYVAGINSVVLNLYWDKNKNSQIDAGEFLSTTLTGDNPATVGTTETGWYYFDVAAGGTWYIVEIAAGNFAPGGPLYGYSPTSAATFGGVLKPSGGIEKVVTLLAPIENYVTADFGFNIPPAAIGDRVWVDENADGVQDAGEPGIPNVTVRLTGTEAFGPSVVLTTTTDADGGYLFTGIYSGTYTVTVISSTLPAGLATNPTFDDDGIATPHTSVLTVNDGQEYRDADFGYDWSSPCEIYTPGAPGCPSPTGAIGDRVWVDADGDGVQDPSEPGLAGIAVTLRYDSNGDGLVDASYATTTTNAAGNYIFDNLPAGTYQVVVNGGTTPAGFTQTGDPDATLDNQSNQIPLAPGDVFLNADFGYKPDAGTTSTVGDRVWLDASADGVQDAGEPGIPGVTVALLDGNGQAVATTQTDAGGIYTFTGVVSGTYTVWVNDTSNVLGDLVQTFDFDGLGTPNRSTVFVSSGSTITTQDFGYTPGGHTPGDGMIGDTIFLDRNANNAFDPGEGLEGVRIILTASDGITRVATTDENGNYRFGSLDPSGTYTVTVDTTTLPAGLINTADPDGGLDSRSVVNLGAPGSDGVNDPDGTDNGINLGQDFGYFAIPNPNTISGTIWRDTDANGVQAVTETGRYPNVTVVLYDTNGNVVGSTTTDASGNYTFTNVPNGTYTVDVTDQANVLNGTWHSSGNQSVAVDGTSKNDPYTLSVTGNQTVTTVDFGYYTAPASLGDFVWEDTNMDGIQQVGEPGLAGITVTLTITYPNGVTTTLMTRTDPTGIYTFGNLLLDENFDGVGTPGVGGTEPAFSISAALLLNYISSPIYQTTPDLDSNRLSGDPAFVVKGAANTTYDFGEIAVPTAVTLAGFTLTPGDRRVMVSWTTGSEVDNLGFNLYRSEAPDGQRGRANPALIPAAELGAAGAAYAYTDTGLSNGVTYYYWLGALDTHGAEALYALGSATPRRAGKIR